MKAMGVCKLPESIAFDTAAAMMLKGMTVEYLLKRTLPQGGLQAGDHILWHAAAGGVGLIACQWAKSLGYQLIGTAGSDEKCQLAKEHGAAHVINYKTENFVERVKAITGGKGVKVVYDSVGKDTFERLARLPAPVRAAGQLRQRVGPGAAVRAAASSAPRVRCTSRAPTLFTHTPRARRRRRWPTTCSRWWPAAR